MSPPRKETGSTSYEDVTLLVKKPFLLGLLFFINMPGVGADLLPSLTSTVSRASEVLVENVGVLVGSNSRLPIEEDALERVVVELKGSAQAVVATTVGNETCPVNTDECPCRYVEFWLHTSCNPNGTKLEFKSLADAPWTPGDLKVLVHGYTSNKDETINEELRPAYLKIGCYNVISVDWSVLARKGCYLEAVQNMRLVGQCISGLIKTAVAVKQLCGYNVHLLGHSLGAHVVAWASINIPYLYRLTKLDPALPYINSRSAVPGCAEFVDVYHTNSGILGQLLPSGQLDVYYNNYVHQPGCGCDIVCSHVRCLFYYAESILCGPIKAFSCGSWDNYTNGTCLAPKSYELVDIGEHADRKVRGKYMVFTNAKPPYGLGEEFYTSLTVFSLFNVILDKLAECPVSPIIETIYGDMR